MHTLRIAHIDITTIPTLINHWKVTLFHTLLTDKILQPAITLIIAAINKNINIQLLGYLAHLDLVI